ncbi:hypothetical protein SOM55_12435 [Pseudomonas coleopterorum]|uniref:hypothetical protein n=1 Tax=Pseudomonas coleopterorum TaxID=1605838 RepID=UPI002A6A4F5B|nr:hypothetical protein [Pseudomonas coleopterorum]MDY1047602.1 hypothetical protein [Pseudomonas coleopterorum]
MSDFSPLNIFKSQAKQLVRDQDVKLSVAQETLAREAGFADYHELAVVAQRNPKDPRLMMAVFGIKDFDDAIHEDDVYSDLDQELEDQLSGAIAETNASEFTVDALTVDTTEYADSTGMLILGVSLTYKGQQDQERVFLTATVELLRREGKWLLAEAGVSRSLISFSPYRLEDHNMARPKTIMRYLTLSKFKYLLEDEGIYVSAACDQLDLQEGDYDHTFLTKHLQSQPGQDQELMSRVDEMMLGSKEVGRKTTYLSCWYNSDEESSEMWKDYGEGGVAIFSTHYALEFALPRPLDQAAEFYTLTYDDQLKPQASQQPFRVKNESYKQENEYRLELNLLKYSVLTGFEARNEVRVGGVLSHESAEITSCMSPESLARSHHVIRRKGKGYVLTYPLTKIIHEVRMHPSATDIELEEVRASLKACGINCTVRHSALRKIAH